MAEKRSEVEATNAPRLKLVATSSGPDDRKDSRREIPEPQSPVGYFKSAQWSADGTCVITNSADNCIRTFVVPPELLEERVEPLHLLPYAEIVSYSPTDAVTAYPGFDLRDAATTLVLFTINDHPIRLHSALTSNLIASYPLIHPTTESYIKPNCLAYQSNGTHFIAGSESLISTFDLSRPGQEPISSLQTGPKSRKTTWDNPATSTRGIVSALATDKQHNVLAAGTLTRHVGLYDASGSGESLGVFAVQDTEADKAIGGRGITQVFWSPCGRYLYIAERKAVGAMIYDIRKTGQLLGWLEGRHADTNQRLAMDLNLAGQGGEHEIWAGGTDGVVRVWTNPHLHEGGVKSDAEHTVHRDAVSNAVMHPSAGVLATVSGQRHFLDPSQLQGDMPAEVADVSLKLWSLM